MKILLKTEALKKYFPTPRGPLHAVDNVNIEITEGQTLGVVGESGCGKSTLGRLLLRAIPATSGRVLFDGCDILKCSAKEMKNMRKEMQMIFQDPYSSLNPRMTVFETIAEPLLVNGITSSDADVSKRVNDIMDKVGLAERVRNAYPHEMDGGRRQRVGVARALALSPRFIVCDEPVSALDVSIQAQILNLLMDLQNKLGLTYMFITHNLSVVRHISDHVVVMYLGQCVEQAPSKELFKKPLHPYTKALLAAIPIPDIAYRDKTWDIIQGEVVSPVNPKPGCRFLLRCPNRSEKCTATQSLREISSAHFVACTLYDR